MTSGRVGCRPANILGLRRVVGLADGVDAQLTFSNYNEWWDYQTACRQTFIIDRRYRYGILSRDVQVQVLPAWRNPQNWYSSMSFAATDPNFFMIINYASYDERAFLELGE